MNEMIFRFLNDFAGRAPWSDSLIAFIAVDFVFIFMALVIIDSFVRRKSGREKRNHLAMVITSFIVGGLGWTISVLIKLVYTHPRPFEVLARARQLIDEGGNSFPSGHSTFLFTVTFVLLIFDKKLAKFGLIVATLVGLSRIIAGIHWPADILGGAILAALVTFAARPFIKKLQTKLQ